MKYRALVHLESGEVVRGKAEALALTLDETQQALSSFMKAGPEDGGQMNITDDAGTWHCFPIHRIMYISLEPVPDA